MIFLPRRGQFLDYTDFTYAEFVFTYGPMVLGLFRHIFVFPIFTPFFLLILNLFKTLVNYVVLSVIKKNYVKSMNTLGRYLLFFERIKKETKLKQSFIFLILYWCQIRSIAGIKSYTSIICCPEINAVFVRKRQNTIWDNTEHHDLLGRRHNYTKEVQV